jgi:hypothetical protein
MAKRGFSELRGVLFLTGPPGAGKSSAGKELSARHPSAVHVDVDTLRGFVRSRFADPTLDWDDETYAQFRLARTAARAIAEIYVAAGYLAILDDMYVPSGGEVDKEIWSSASSPILGRVVLLPDVPVALARNADRDRGKITGRLASLIPRITREFHAAIPGAPEWAVIDNSKMTVEETATAIVAIATRSRRSTK